MFRIIIICLCQRYFENVRLNFSDAELFWVVPFRVEWSG